ncbi:hypothetical protein KP509_12G089800 [Ceratopteris richardii]|uniref:C3H1-type domain-containing protein n=1 Tax=Ceratopteris richardii TaxID=49495 RepID=A0A8T2TNR0_CERRI|nr:hypothetical protein KP509_12G089800 [Ceratopteris richardii]
MISMLDQGTDCEYRHSKAARLNPRDCRFWLAGNCLNSSCPFRHPPLDGRPVTSVATISHGTGGSSTISSVMAAAPSVQSTSAAVSVPSPASKSAVPCFFFSEGYCTKGVKCPFSHAPFTQFRKESLTYQRPQVNEQSIDGQANGVSYAKQQLQDFRPVAQARAPAKVSNHVAEPVVSYNNLYKLNTSGASALPLKLLPVVHGDASDQLSKLVRSKTANRQDGIKHDKLMENRITQTHLFNDNAELFVSEEQLVRRCNPIQATGRTFKQIEQSNTSYSSKVQEELTCPEIQDAHFEPENHYSTRELDSGDLRNHLKRKFNQIKGNSEKEFLMDLPGLGRLPFTAVPVSDSGDFTSNDIKRLTQEKESLDFSGPKSLAQIKAEKAKASEQYNTEVRNSAEHPRTIDPDVAELRKVVQSTLDFGGNITSASLEEPLSRHPEQNVLEVLGTSQKATPGSLMRSSNGSFVEPVSNSKAGKNSKCEGNMQVNKCTYDAQDQQCTESHNACTDEFIDDGSKALENAASMEFLSDEEEDDFAKKLGSFLS